MKTGRIPPSRPVVAAMVCSAAVTAQFIAGKATRDAFYLAHLDVRTLPTIVAATAGVSILLVIASSASFRRLAPGVLVPGMFVASGVALAAEWLLASSAPTAAARLVYLQVSGVGPMLGSGFWLVVSERFDPRTARRHFAQIAGAGTLGGLVGGLLAERMATVFPVEAMLPLLAVLNVGCGVMIRRLAGPQMKGARMRAEDIVPDLAPAAPGQGLKAMADTHYLRDLAGLVLLGTAAAALIDFVFKAEAVSALGRGDALLRFFSIYYAAVSIVTFLIQSSLSQAVLEKLGLAAGAATPSAALILGTAGALVSPGLPGALAARAGESAFRGSIFRSSYEIFFTPIPATAKRAAKSIIDVGCDRLGDAAGAGLIRVLIMALPAASSRAILVGAAGCSALAMVFASRLHRGYVRTLEHNLLGREVDIDLSSVDDLTTRTVMLRTLPEADLRTLLAAATEGDEGTTWAVAQASPQPASPQPASAQPASARPTPPAVSQTQDRELEQIVALRSRDAARIRSVLSTIDAPSAAVVAQVIPLLAWDAVASDAIVALRRSSAGHTGLLVDALIDPGQPFAVRRRVARVFSAWSSQRAVDGVVLGLADARFEVRFHCARSLLTIAGAAPGVAIPEPTIHAAVLREVSVGRPVWESNRLLGELDDGDAHPIDQFLRDRAGRSLQHVFTLLSLILPARPLAIAFRGLHTDDQELKGTALEYLEGVLPPDIREHLWPFLEDTRPAERRARSRDQILSDLMRSYDSIALNLDQVQQKAASATPEDR